MRGLAALVVSGAAAELPAQHIVSVPFTNGFIGTRGSSAGSADDVKTFATLGIARLFFIQNSSTTVFEVQGNDIPGTLRIVRTSGTTLDIPALANWRMNSGSTTDLIGILPQPASPITLAYSGGSIQITNGANPGGTSIGGYVAGFTGTPAADGSDQSGNAAQSQLLNGLNAYLSTVVSSRPAGPVTVTAQSTTSTTPTLAGTATLAAGEALSVVVNGVQYTTSSTPAVVRNANAWTLALTAPLAVGTYPVTATVTDADGFTLSDATDNELVITGAGGTVTIGGSFTANGRTYDGTTAATGSTGGLTLAGVNGADVVSIASVTLAFQSAAAGANRTVVISGVTLGGANAAQYTVSYTGAPTATATIAAKALTIGGVSAASRVYDATPAATLTGTAAYAGLASGESFAVTGTPVATFASAGIGTGKAVTVTGYTAPSANYTVAQPTGLTANVTARPLTIGGAFTASSKTFDGTTAATIASNALTLPNAVGGDAVSLTGLAAAFADAAVGTGKTVSLTAASLTGAAAGNYTLTLTGAPTTTADITSAGGGGGGGLGTVTIGGSFTATDRPYDGTTAATGVTTGLTLSGVAPCDQVTIASVTLGFQSAGAGAGKTVVITGVTLGGTNGAQYTVNLTGAPTATASITALPLTITGIAAASRPYDGTIVTTLTGMPAYVGLRSGESVAVTGTPTATLATAAVGTGKPVTVAGYTPPNANYTLTQPTGLTANVTPRALTVGGTFTAANRTFDGTTAATVVTNALTLAGVVAPDVVTLANVTAAFADPSAGNGKPVSITGATLAGAAAANYALSLAGAPTTTASITARLLTIGGTFSVADKVFDGNADATITSNGLRLVGVQPGDEVALTWATAAFTDAAVGTAKRVTLRAVGLTGAAASTYTLVMAGAPTTTASILPASPPSAPRAVAATATAGSIAVAWTAPESSGCRAITGYVVETSTDGGRTWQPRAATGAAPTAATLANLTNNVAHLVRVGAVNPCGTGAFAAAPGPVVPVGPLPSGVAPVASTTTVVPQDTSVRVSGGGFTLRLRADDETGAAVPMDSSRTLQLEHGGRATADGSGFAPGTYVTAFLLAPGGPPTRLGTEPVAVDGTFTAKLPIAATLPAGAYTLQVVGVDPAAVPRAVNLDVEVVPPPPDLDLTATPDEKSPAVGDTITITLTVTNVGRGPAIDVVIPRAFTEPGFTVVRTTPLEGSYRAATQEWTIGRIEPGARARMLVTAVVLPHDAAPRTAP